MLVGTAALAWLAVATSAGAAYPGANGRIAFDRADGHIYSVKSDGTGILKLGLGTTPAYSPNGASIAFVVDGDIWTMNADGSNRRQVTAGASFDGDPTWSPDGAKLAFASDRRGGGIFTLRSSAPYGTATRLVATPPPSEAFGTVDSSPAWATNGRIYFTRYTFDNESLCGDYWDTMSVAVSTKVVREWRFLAVSADPAPRGHAIVYHYSWADGACNSAHGIYIANADGSHPRAVTPLRDRTPLDGDPVFSPDAGSIAFQRGRYIDIVNPNGTALHRLVVGSAPSWQPLP